MSPRRHGDAFGTVHNCHMPTSLTPPPKDDETECGNCGAYIYHGLLKCPNCGAYLTDPIPLIEKEEPPKVRPKNKFSLAMESMMRKIRGEPHPAEQLFTGALREAALFDDLLRKIGGDRSTVERLIEYERQKQPGATRLIYLQRAISRWEHENR